SLKATATSVTLQTLKATGIGSFANVQTFVGPTGATGTAIGPNAPNLWRIVGLDQAVLNDTWSLQGFSVLTGGADADVFMIEPAGGVTGAINGGSGADTIDYTAWSSPVTFNHAQLSATAVARYGTIEFVRGGASDEDQIIGPEKNITWLIDGADAGTVNSVRFSSFERLQGGSFNDVFKLNTT